jgi:hypothetical protein
VTCNDARFGQVLEGLIKDRLVQKDGQTISLAA